MAKKSIISIQRVLEKLTLKWWFYVLILICFFLPSYASKGIDPQEIQTLIREVLSNPLIYQYPMMFVVTKITTILLIISIFMFRRKISRIFNLYVAILTISISIFQHMAITNTYGFAIIVGNLVVVLIVALFWIWESISNKNEFEQIILPFWKWWVIPFAFFAFWYPVNSAIKPDFSLLNLFANEAGLTYCMMTPLILAVLITFYPNVNKATLRVTSFVGILFGIINMLTWFIFESTMWWMGVVHLPLLFISIFTFIISIKNLSIESNDTSISLSH